MSRIITGDYGWLQPGTSVLSRGTNTGQAWSILKTWRVHEMVLTWPDQPHINQFLCFSFFFEELSDWILLQKKTLTGSVFVNKSRNSRCRCKKVCNGNPSQSRLTSWPSHSHSSNDALTSNHEQLCPNYICCFLKYYNSQFLLLMEFFFNSF